jgi:hypothetical protein
MSSECYWCIAGKPAYGNQQGTMGYPFASCLRCNVFCCGHHGQRDNGAQEFYCFDCDKTILIVSAINAANLAPQTISEIARRSKRIKLIKVLLEHLFSSVDEFLRRKPGYGNYFELLDESYIDYDNWTDQYLKETFRKFPAGAQKLLVAAAIIIADTDTEEELRKIDDPLFLNLKTSVKVPTYG